MSKFNYFTIDQAEQFNFVMIPKDLFKGQFRVLTSDEKLLYSLMLNNMHYSKDNHWIDDDRRLYIKFSVASVMDYLSISKATAIKCIKSLEKIGLIEKKNEAGKATVFYVLNFMSATGSGSHGGGSPEEAETEDRSQEAGKCKKRPVQKLDRSKTTGSKSKPDPVQKLNPNNTNNKNNNKNILSNPIKSERGGDPDPIGSDWTEDDIKEQIEYDLMAKCWDHEEKQIADVCVGIMVDVMNTPDGEEIRVNGQNVSARRVKSQFAKISAHHIQYIQGNAKNTSAKISKIGAYYRTALYNAPRDMDLYFTHLVRHDFGY